MIFATSAKSNRRFRLHRKLSGTKILFFRVLTAGVVAAWLCFVSRSPPQLQQQPSYRDDEDKDEVVVPVLKPGGQQQLKFTFPTIEERVRYYLGSLVANHAMMSGEDELCQLNLYDSERPMYNEPNGGPWLFNKDILESRLKVENTPYAADTLLRIVPKLGRPETDLIVMHFGDTGRVTHPLPTFAKARPLNHQYANSTILIPLNVKRHFGKVGEVKVNDVPWDEKTSRLIWRGAPTGHGSKDRIALIQKQILHHGIENDVDIGLTILNDDGDLVKPPMTMKEQLRFKYLLSLEGNDVASGLKWMLYSNSVVFMPTPTVVSWAMEDRLVPWYHYIPLEKDLSDLHDKIRWARNNDKICKQISQQASEFMEDLWVSDKAKNDTEEILLKVVQRYQETTRSLLSNCNGTKGR